MSTEKQPLSHFSAPASTWHSGRVAYWQGECFSSSSKSSLEYANVALLLLIFSWTQWTSNIRPGTKVHGASLQDLYSPTWFTQPKWKTTIMSSSLYCDHLKTGGDQLDDQEPTVWEQLIWMFSLRTLGFVRHGRKQETDLLGKVVSTATFC